MTLARTHRRLSILMALIGLIGYWGGVGFEQVGVPVAALLLVIAMAWSPSGGLGRRLEWAWLGIGGLLSVRALLQIFALQDDVVGPVVDLLLLLLCVEAFRPVDALNGIRIYALSFTLLLAGTAYRPGIVFAVAFAGFLVVATVTLAAGHLRRQSVRWSVPHLELRRGFLVAMAGLSTVTIASGVALFLIFPRMGSQGTSGRPLSGMSMAGFSDEVSLGSHGSRIEGNPSTVLRVEFPRGRPSAISTLHWRGLSYDHFDGVRWSRTNEVRRLPDQRSAYRDFWPDSSIVQEIYAAPIRQRVLFALHPTIGVASRGGSLIRENSGDYRFWGSRSSSYLASSVANPPSDEALQQVTYDVPRMIRPYLQLPALPDRVHELADSLTREHENVYDRARALERWFHTEFAYTLDLPATAAESTLDHFLFERRAGHCEYFSTAMIVLLRAAGIPARQVNGFLGGEWNDLGSYLVVTQNEAHSWVEVFFDDYGWVTFDPTPSGGTGIGGGRAWNWPGRFLFDGLQHRWNKWVLDFGVDDQLGFLNGLSGLLGTRSEDLLEPVSGTSPARSNRLVPLGIVGGVMLLSLFLLARPTRHSVETRLYLRLVDRARRQGWIPDSEVTPEQLLAAVREHQPSNAVYASRVVGLYLRARFAGARLDDGERRDMLRALRLSA